MILPTLASGYISRTAFCASIRTSWQIMQGLPIRHWPDIPGKGNHDAQYNQKHQPLWVHNTLVTAAYYLVEQLAFIDLL